MRKGGEEVTQAIREEITNVQADASIHTTRTRCNGRCKDAPIVIAYPQGTWYKEVNKESACSIVHHLIKGTTKEEAVLYHYEDGGFAAPAHSTSEDGIVKVPSLK